eukprot:Awhi_evm1s3953
MFLFSERRRRRAVAPEQPSDDNETTTEVLNATSKLAIDENGLSEAQIMNRVFEEYQNTPDTFRTIPDYFFENPHNLKKRNEHHQSFFHLAAQMGDEESCKWILSKNVIDIDVVDISRATPLMYTLIYKQEKCAEFLMRNGASLTISPQNCKNLLNLWGDYDVKGRLPIHAAVRQCSLKTVESLAEHGSSLESVSQEMEKFTPLHTAAFYGRPEITKFLLRCGTDPHVRCRSGYTPLDDALRTFSKIQHNPELVEEKLKVIELLTKFGGGKSMKTRAGIRNDRIRKILNKTYQVPTLESLCAKSCIQNFSYQEQKEIERDILKRNLFNL